MFTNDINSIRSRVHLQMITFFKLFGFGAIKVIRYGAHSFQQQFRSMCAKTLCGN